MTPISDEMPLVSKLIDGLASHYVSLANNQWNKTFTKLADVSRIRSERLSRTLVTKQTNKTIHICPEGDYLAGFRAPGETLCGLSFELKPNSHKGWERAKRGSFISPGLYNPGFKACSRCAKKGQNEKIYPEAHETSESGDFLWPDERRQLDTRLHEIIRERLIEGLNSKETKDQYAFYQGTLQAGKEVYLEALALEAERSKGRIIDHYIHYYRYKEDYEQLYPRPEGALDLDTSQLFKQRIAALFAYDDFKRLLKQVTDSKSFGSVWYGADISAWDTGITAIVEQRLKALASTV